MGELRDPPPGKFLGLVGSFPIFVFSPTTIRDTGVVFLIWQWVKTVLGSHFGGLVNSPPILEPILVVGLNRMFTGG